MTRVEMEGAIRTVKLLLHEYDLKALGTTHADTVAVLQAIRQALKA